MFYLFLVILFLTWIPYASEAIYISFVEPRDVGPIYNWLPTIFAKSSMLWCSLFHLTSNFMINKKKSILLRLPNVQIKLNRNNSIDKSPK